MDFLTHYFSFAGSAFFFGRAVFFGCSAAGGFSADPFSAVFFLGALFCGAVSVAAAWAGSAGCVRAFGLGTSSWPERISVMWLVRFRMVLALPIALGCIRFIVGPPSTQTLETQRPSTSPISFWAALATADFKIFSTTFAACRGVDFKIVKASAAFLPR